MDKRPIKVMIVDDHPIVRDGMKNMLLVFDDLQVELLESNSYQGCPLGVLLNSDQRPKYESIQDSILDLACYAALLSQILQDEDQVGTEGAG